MNNLATRILDKQQAGRNTSIGHLLINGKDEIIYANKQARRFLGLLADEALPAGQKFLPLIQSAYRCYPTIAWLNWPKRPSATTNRYLILSASHNASFSLLKVEIVEQIIVDSQEIWVVALDLVESSSETAVACSTIC